jgi:hypothetical protein
MTPVIEVAVKALKRQYPHVDTIADWRAQQSVRLLWERVFDLEGRLQAAEGTLTRVVTRTNEQDAEIAAAHQAAIDATGEAQLTAGERAAGGGLSPGEPATGPGSHGEPIIPMSIDPTTMEADIKASLFHWSRDDYSYWLAVVQDPWQGGDAKWYQGWDAYMEERARPGNAGFASHDLLPEPALYTTPPTTGYPTGGWT